MKRMLVAVDLFDVVFEQSPATMIYHIFPQVALPAIEHMYKGYALGEVGDEEFFAELGGDQAPSFYLQAIFSKIQLSPEVLETLEQLSSKIGVAFTATMPKSWIDYIQNIGIAHYVTHIITSETAAGTKPHKDFFDSLLDQTQLEAQEIVVVEKNAKNLIVPKQLGMKTVLVGKEDDYQSAGSKVMH